MDYKIYKQSNNYFSIIFAIMYYLSIDLYINEIFWDYIIQKFSRIFLNVSQILNQFAKNNIHSYRLLFYTLLNNETI